MGASGSSGELEQPLAAADDGPKSTCLGLVVGPVVAYYAAAFAVAVAISYATYFEHFQMHHEQKQLPSYLYTLPYMVLAATSAILATGNALQHIFQHVAFNENGKALKVTALVILSMVPVYAVCSGIALCENMSRFKVAVPLNAFREFYEAMVLIAFMQFIAEFWGGTKRLARILDTDDLSLKTVFPTPARKADELLAGTLSFKVADLSVFPLRRAPGSEYLAWTYVGALQYAFVMMAYVLANITMWSMVLRGRMDEAKMDSYLQGLKGVKAASNLWAMYNLLVLFEYLRECANTEERMNRIRPISKFFCIKLIVLFSLWQELIMTFCAKKGLLPTFRGWEYEWDDQKKTAEGAVNFLVCLEMLLFAQWHRYAYPWEEKWDIGVQASDAFRAQQYKPVCCLLHCGVGKMVDDVGYLLVNRIPRQHKCVHMLAQARRDRSMDIGPGSELARLFEYFELDEHKEVSAAQLHHILVKSGFAANMADAIKKVEEADRDNSGRLSYKEFTERLIVR